MVKLPPGLELAALARAQTELAHRIELAGTLPLTTSWVGCDCAVRRDRTVAVAVLWDPFHGPCAGVAVRTTTDFPYIPGYLSFREVPALLAALVELDAPGVPLMVDGHGVIHPRGLGIAAHLALVAGRRGIGVAKRPFVGEGPAPGRERGNRAPMFVAGRQRGWSVRTRTGVKPVYASPGHGVGIRGLPDAVLGACGGVRLPEPIRWADRGSRLVRRGDAVPDWLRVVDRPVRWEQALPG